MRLPRFRFTIRWMMLAVAIVAAIFGGSLVGMRTGPMAKYYADQAQIHARRRAEMTQILASVPDDKNLRYRKYIAKKGMPEELRIRILNHWYADGSQLDDAIEAGVESFRAGINYHTAMETKYRHAARYSWLPVAPDPFEPE
jgi:hypothetical protein